jgi:Ulp1 family protease
VSIYDYFTLEEGEYLNDSIINFHLRWLFEERLKPEDRKDVHIFSSHFYTKLKR